MPFLVNTVFTKPRFPFCQTTFMWTEIAHNNSIRLGSIILGFFQWLELIFFHNKIFPIGLPTFINKRLTQFLTLYYFCSPNTTASYTYKSASFHPVHDNPALSRAQCPKNSSFDHPVSSATCGKNVPLCSPFLI